MEKPMEKKKLDLEETQLAENNSDQMHDYLDSLEMSDGKSVPMGAYECELSEVMNHENSKFNKMSLRAIWEVVEGDEEGRSISYFA